MDGLSLKLGAALGCALGLLLELGLELGWKLTDGGLLGLDEGPGLLLGNELGA